MMDTQQINNDTLVEVKGLSKDFGRAQALDNLSFTLAPGHIVGLLGPNGSGKTTLIKLLAGLLTPTEGSIRIMGSAPGTFTKSVVSYLPDTTYLNENMTADGTIGFFESFYTDFDPARARQMMDLLGVDRTRPIKTLSKGTKEKVQLILVMSRRAKLFLLDEPIGGVDPATRDYILQTIIQNYEEDATILISTHLISDIETILDEVLILKDGRLVKQAQVDVLREENGMSVDELFREAFKW